MRRQRLTQPFSLSEGGHGLARVQERYVFSNDLAPLLGSEFPLLLNGSMVRQERNCACVCVCEPPSSMAKGGV